MSNQYPPPKRISPPTTIAMPSARRRTEPPLCVVRELRDLITGDHHTVPNKTAVLIGRDPDRNDIVVPHAFVSARHATAYPLPDYLRVIDHGSTNGLFVNGVDVSEAHVHPGTVFGVAQANHLALSAVMASHAVVLDRVVGKIRVVNRALQAPRERRCLVIRGARGACLDQVVHAMHGVATDGSRSLRVVAPDGFPRDLQAQRALAADVGDGWLVIDMRDARPLDFPLDDALVHMFLSPGYGGTIIVMQRLETSIPGPLRDVQPDEIDVPTIEQRLKEDGLPQLVNAIFAAVDLSFGYEALPSELLEAIKDASWQRNFEEVWDVLIYVGCKKAGRPARAHYLTSDGANALRWLEEIGIDRALVGGHRRKKSDGGRRRMQPVGGGRGKQR